MAGSKLPDSVKKGYTESQQFIQDIKHISDFKELPNSEVALTQQSFNDAMVKELWLNCLSSSIKDDHLLTVKCMLKLLGLV